MDDGRASYKGKPVFGSPDPKMVIVDEAEGTSLADLELPEGAQIIALGGQSNNIFQMMAEFDADMKTSKPVTPARTVKKSLTKQMRAAARAKAKAEPGTLKPNAREWFPVLNGLRQAGEFHNEIDENGALR